MFAYFIYKFPTLLVDLDFKAPMPTHHPVQKLSDSRSWFVLGRFRFRLFWKIFNQDDDMTIPIDLWKVTDVHSNLFHHTGWYWYCFWHCSQLLTYSLISAAISLSNLVIHSVFSSMWGHYLGVSRISNNSVHVYYNFHLAFFVFNNQSSPEEKWPSFTT